MKTLTIPGKHYMVRSSTGCTVTQEISPGKYITAIVPADEDTPVFAHAGKFDVDDEAAIVTEVFNSAPYQKLRLLGVVGGNKLPSGYTRLAYLESSGTQNILIPYTITYSTGLYLKGQLSSTVTETGMNFPFSSGKSNFPNTRLSLYAPAWTNNNSWLYSYGKFSGIVNALSGIDYSLFEAWHNWFSLRFIKVINCRTSKIHSTTSGQNWLWGAENGNNFEATAQDFNLFNNSKFRIYRASIRQDFNEVTRDLIPALDPTGTPCMYDLVTRTPFLNKGTGSFIAGIETQSQLDTLILKLPDRTGQDVGTLQVRLAEALQTPENESTLDSMLAKNWEITQAA